ncbi:MAG TPA: c-type cytochrome [Anaeromyxobacter sp.]
MRKLGFLLLCAAAGCSAKPRLPATPQGTSVLEVRGAVKGGPHALGRADLDQLPRLKVRGVEPRSGRVTVWEGTSVAALVSDRVDLRKGADTAIVRTGDRTAIPVPLTVIRQLKPVLADRADGVRLAMPVLVWPTVDQNGLETDPRLASWWARDVVAFEIVDWRQTFAPALAPPEGAVDAARRGSGVFAESCIACHRMRGAGGERGPDLTTVAARLHQPAFLALLPSHPGWSERRPRDLSEEAAGELWTFLRAVARAGAPDAALTADRGGAVPAIP